jgi:hypothetical protein
MKDIEDFVRRGQAAQSAADEAAYFAAVKELIKGAAPIGAYCLGMSAALRTKTGEFPPRLILERLVQCRSVAEGDAIYREVLEYTFGGAAQ